MFPQDSTFTTKVLLFIEESLFSHSVINAIFLLELIPTCSFCFLAIRQLPPLDSVILFPLYLWARFIILQKCRNASKNAARAWQQYRKSQIRLSSDKEQESGQKYRENGKATDCKLQLKRAKIIMFSHFNCQDNLLSEQSRKSKSGTSQQLLVFQNAHTWWLLLQPNLL